MTFSVRERMLKDIAADLSIVAVVSEADALLLVSRLAYLLDGGMPAADILEKLADRRPRPKRRQLSKGKIPETGGQGQKVNDFSDPAKASALVMGMIERWKALGDLKQNALEAISTARKDLDIMEQRIIKAPDEVPKAGASE